MLFSVVIPLYNKRDQIAETVRCVLGQTHGGFELVVVDDGSTDGSADIVRKFDDARIRLIRQCNQGAAAARNAGSSAARYPFVAFLDADDQWDAEYLATIAALIADFPACGAYGTGYRRRAVGGRQIANRLEDGLARAGRGVIDDYFQASTRGDQPFYTSSVCLRRSVVAQLGGFKAGVTHGEDLDLWARVALQFPIAFDPVPKATYRLDASNRAMQKCPPLGWEFRESARQYRQQHPGRRLSPALDLHVEHIELYHASLNLPSTRGSKIRHALKNVAWTRHPLRKAKIWTFSLFPIKCRRAIIQFMGKQDR